MAHTIHGCTLFAVLVAATAVAATPTVVGTDPGLLETARALPEGATIRVTGLQLAEDLGNVTLVLERFRVFAADARIRVHTEEGEVVHAAPDNAYLRGYVEGRPRSVVLLTAREGGGMRGVITDGGRYWIAAPKGGASEPYSGLRVRELDADREFAANAHDFSCGTDLLGDPKGTLEAPLPFRSTPPASKSAATYTVGVAVETDYEYYNMFNDVADATDYVGDLFAYASTIYSAEVDASFLVVDVSLWTTSNDPWAQSNSRCRLVEFGRYWNDNNDGIDRTIAHMLSGKSGGGIAWVGVLCDDEFLYNISTWNCGGLTPVVDNYGGDYGYSGGLDGDFDIDDPGIIWDTLVVTHEIGHNFNSPHTHCYGSVGGDPNPIDECYAGECGTGGCYCGPTSLPCGSPGSGCATIMSYCHLQSGGLGNISPTFGAGHPWGNLPERVPTRMNDHLVSAASFDPACFDWESNEIFSDAFESGDTSAWSQ